MPMGLLTEEEFMKEFGTKEKESHAEIKESHPQGRAKGDLNIPDSMRKIIGEESVINGRASALNLASQFGISPTAVSAYANGTTSSSYYNTPKPSILNHITRARARASKRAAKVLNSSLLAISQEKLDYSDPKDLASIAKDMSTIIKNMEPHQQESTQQVNQAVQFVIYAPPFRREESFEVIDVKE